MDTRKNKPTLAQIRTLYPFDTPTFARLADVGTITVYHALLQKPIYTQDAEKILAALSQHTSLQLSFEQVDMVTWEDYLFLWIIRASPPEQQDQDAHLVDEYHFVYARDRKHATALASNWLNQRPHLPRHSFTPCPEGLTVGNIAIPGHHKAD